MDYASSVRPAAVVGAVLLVLALVIRILPAVAADPDLRNLAWKQVGSTGFALALLLLHRYDAALASSRALRPIGFLGRIHPTVERRFLNPPREPRLTQLSTT